MSTFENIFKITADGSITLNKEELRGNDIFKRFIGNKKENIQDMMYIYLMGDPRSMYDHLGLADKQEAVRRHINRDIGWSAPPTLKGAVDEYKRIIETTPTGKSFLAANKTLFNIGQDLNDINDNSSYLKSLLQKKMETLQLDTLGDVEVVTAIKECKGLMSEIVKIQKDTQAVIKGLPDMLKTVNSLASSWANEGNGTKEVYGGGELNSREE